MHRAARVLCNPYLWLVLFFVIWVGVFYALLPAPPHFTVLTGAVRDDCRWDSSGRWARLQGISDDCGQVTIATYEGHWRCPDCRLEVWDTRTGVDVTPTLWKDADWLRLLSDSYRRSTRMTDLLAQPSGKDMMNDGTTWDELCHRFKMGREKALENLRKTIRPVDESEAHCVFPSSVSFAPDGLRLGYVARNGWPLYIVHESLGDGTVVEDVRTGTRLAFLAGVTDQVHIAPGGETAVSVNHPTKNEGDQPRLILWDLKTSTRRAGLLLPEAVLPISVEYSADGRYVFAQYTKWDDWSGGLRWWDAATGRQVGAVVNPGDTALISSDSMLVTHPLQRRGNAAAEGYVMGFWDVTTGAQRGEWNLVAPKDGGGMLHRLVASQDGQFAAAEYYPDCGRVSSQPPWPIDRLVDALSTHSRQDRQQVLVWNLAERYELARLPGSSAAFSRDGRWLATLDDAGVVRGWEIPVRPPWGCIVGYAVGCALCSWVLAVLPGRLWRRWR